MQNIKNLTDEELIKLCTDGNAAASEVLLSRYKNTVKAICRNFFLTGGDFEDLVQEGMIALFGCITSYDSKFGPFGNYATTCVKNKVIDAIRRSQNTKNQPLADFVELQKLADGEFATDPSSDPEAVYILAEVKDHINKILDVTLTADEKQLFNIFLDGASYLEIAEQTNLTVKQVDNRLQRIKNKLKAATAKNN